MGARTGTSVERHPAPQRGSARFVLCDDAPDVRDFLRMAIAMYSDMPVAGEAADGREAIEQTARLQPDVVVLDLSMPRMNGIDALPQILAAAPLTRVVVMSGRDEAETNVLELGASAYIRKGTSLDEIVTILRQVAGLVAPAVSSAPITHDQEMRLSSLTLDLLSTSGADGYFQYLSPSWERTLGWTPDELRARPFIEFVHPDDVAATVAEIGRLLDDHDTVSYQNRYRSSDGSYAWLSWRATRALDGLIYASARDVTEQRRVAASEARDRLVAEAEARALKHELEERVARRTAELERRTKELQESMAELDAFAYSVSHDLRAPLRALDGFSRILLDDLAETLDEEHVRHLEFIRSNAQSMQGLVDGLLAFSRLGRRGLEVAEVAPEVLVRQALSDLGPVAERSTASVTVGELPPCIADPTLLKQVFVNLLDNALKFTREVPEPRIEVGSCEVGGETAYFVKDDGVGFDQLYADEVFGVFQRLHVAERFEGTGIGLANVQRIVEKHGGRVWCEASVDAGASFFFTIPGRAS
ncbi:MAG TPA: response regulator [Actinomycetota bacterium]|nr:response regulator [Actinomycetota bacterium]